MVGPTGVGKTTTLDSFFNYLQNISFFDEFRYRMVNEDGLKEFKK